MTDKLRECPSCGGEAIFHKYFETVDGRGDKLPRVTCACGLEIHLTYNEYRKICDEVNYKGGYVSSNKELCDAMHQKMIEKWNTRKPIDRIVEQLEENYSCDVGALKMITLDKAIAIVKGEEN